jgi:hypothetical protein
LESAKDINVEENKSEGGKILFCNTNPDTGKVENDQAMILTKYLIESNFTDLILMLRVVTHPVMPEDSCF